jgi:CspA family cold shock protein
MAQRGLELKMPELCKACTQKTKFGGRLHGRIKWFSLDKGYGFLVQDDGGELFVHRTGIQRTADGSLPALEEGQEVLYEVNDTPKGPQAIGVTPYPDQ